MTPILYATAGQRARRLLLLLALFALSALPASAVLNGNYNFTTSSGTYTPLAGGTPVIGGTTGGIGTFNDGATSGTLPIGFGFVFDCQNYREFSVNAHGMLMLGNNTTAAFNDDLMSTYPVIAPMWQHAHMYDGGGVSGGCTITPPISVSYLTSGIAPNRVLTVDWHTQLCDANGSFWWAGCGAPMMNFQLRLYETSNKIEFVYGALWTSSGQPTSASIGLSGGAGNFLSVTPVTTTTATVSAATANNNVQLHVTPIATGAIYTFTPCVFTIVGRTGPGNSGTPTMISGDTLLRADTALVGTSLNRTPYDFNLSTVGCASKPYTMTITGASASDYRFVSSGNQTLSGTLSAGGSITPTISFTPSRAGRSIATLTMSDGCQSYNYTLFGFGAQPALQFRIGGVVLDTNSGLFSGQVACVDDGPLTLQIDVDNIGGVPVDITGFELYKMDTGFAQGRSPYPYLRGSNGAIIPSTEYYVTLQPFTLPAPSTNIPTTPITVGLNGMRFFVTFLSHYPGKRNVQMFIRTGAQNLTSTDSGGVLRLGMLKIGLFARGVGSMLSDLSGSTLPKAITFPTVPIGVESDQMAIISNPGLCALRVSLRSLQFVSGDVDEFSIVKVPTQSIDQATGDLIIPSGKNDTIWLRFKPMQLGSRRASIRMMTNDSTIQIPGLTERGVYYLDVYGTGKADLYATDVDFGQALIGGTGADQVTKSVHLKNTLNGQIIITKIFFEGADATEFAQTTSPAWPRLPKTINGGADFDLGVVFAPAAGGQTGPRTAMLKMITATGDTIVSRLSGEAGTRTVMVNPTLVNFGTVTAGKMLRKTLTISNTGTMPLTLATPQMSPGSDFTFAPLARLVLAPGQTEYMEVTYAPQTAGGSSATLTFGSNSSSGSVQVTLNGTATKTKQVVVDPSQTATGGTNPVLSGAGDLGLSNDESLSGVAGEEIAGGMRLWQSAPNPARDQAEIRYTLAKGSDVRLELYDAAGRLVRVLDAGNRTAGEWRVTVDVRSLESGTYHYRLSSSTGMVTKTMTVTH